jgi:hypothetical protein
MTRHRLDLIRAGLWTRVVAFSTLCWIGVVCGVRAALVVLGTMSIN